MLLLNKMQLDLSAASEEKKDHSQHQAAKFYVRSVKYLKETYGKTIRFKDPKQPRYCKGVDSKNRDVARMKEPDTMIKIPLETDFTTEDGEKQIWAYCEGAPVIHPNGQYDLGRKRSLTIQGDKVVSMGRDPDLAFYLAYVSPFVRRKVLKIEDPVADAKKTGDKKRETVKRQTAIWNMLTDDDKLRTMASAYGVSGANTKEPDVIRIELENILEVNDDRKKRDPSIRGTDDFLAEMNVNDNILLRGLVQRTIDDKLLSWNADGKWRVGQKIIYHVSMPDLERKFDVLCNYLGQSNNNDKLVDFLGDIVSKEYLDSVKDPRVFDWLAKVKDIKVAFKRKDEIKTLVIQSFLG